MANYNILIVEDEIDLVNILAMVIKDLGYQVFTANDGIEADAVLAKETIDLVLLDLLMPNKDGFDFLKTLRADKKYEKLPVIVLTNYDLESKKDEVMGLGVQDYVLKSNIELAALPSLIRKYLK